MRGNWSNEEWSSASFCSAYMSARRRIPHAVSHIIPVVVETIEEKSNSIDGCCSIASGRLVACGLPTEWGHNVASGLLSGKYTQLLAYVSLGCGNKSEEGHDIASVSFHSSSLHVLTPAPLATWPSLATSSLSLPSVSMSQAVAPTYSKFELMKFGVAEARGVRDTMEDVCICLPLWWDPICQKWSHSESDDCFSSFDNIIKNDVDNTVWLTLPQLSLYALFDGHGGRHCAEFCKNMLPSRIASALHKYLESSINSMNDVTLDSFSEITLEPALLMHALTEAFLDVDSQYCAQVIEKPFNDSFPFECGTTALVALLVPLSSSSSSLVIASTGDSRAVLSRAGVAVSLSFDHRPDRCDEFSRLETLRLQSNIIANDSSLPFVKDGRLNDILSLSRSIGDVEKCSLSKMDGLISDPEVCIEQLYYEDEFLILACDGLWDVISSQTAVNIVRNSLVKAFADSQLEKIRINKSAVETSSRVYLRDVERVAAQALVNEALSRGSSDNVSVIVISFSQTLQSLENTQHPNHTPTASQMYINIPKSSPMLPWLPHQHPFPNGHMDKSYSTNYLFSMKSINAKFDRRPTLHVSVARVRENGIHLPNVSFVKSISESTHSITAIRRRPLKNDENSTNHMLTDNISQLRRPRISLQGLSQLFVGLLS